MKTVADVRGQDRAWWDNLSAMTANQLRELGMAPWDERPEAVLWLFPWAWFDHIPLGMDIQWIDGGREKFSQELDQDRRYGYLAFGILGPRLEVIA